MAEKNSHEEGKRKEDLLSYHSANAANEWQLSEGLMSAGDPEPSCSNANIIDAFSPAMWDQQSGSSNLGFSDNVVQQNSGFLNPLDSRGSHVVPMRPGADGSLGALGWIPPNAMLKGGMLVPGAPGFVPQSLAHFPADVGFIERAARYSCFSGGNFSEIMSPFNLPESMNSYSRHMAPLLGSQEAMAGNGLKLSMSGLQSLNNRMNMAAEGLNSMSRIPSHGSDMNLAASSKGAPIPAEHVTSDGNQFKDENKNESLVPSNDEAKGNLRVSSNDSDRGEFSGRGAQEEPEAPGLESSSKGSGSKKRKRLGQNPEHDQNRGKTAQVAEVRKEDNEVQNPTSITSKPTGKNAKQGPEASDSAKEDYIHIRARRGQATNSHSLAERVRREKISERMKFLQDLVPGCSKVTGKAVMLDEIINYVQSLQRQVEFLSMKLATVNPRLEFNIEGLLSKEILQSHGGPSPLTFPPGMSMAYASLQQGLHQSNLLHELGNSSEALRKSISSQFAAASGSGTFKDHSSHVSNVWEDELHNIVQMGLNSTDALTSQDLSGPPLPPGHMKPEP